MARIVLPNLKATGDDVAERVVVVGDPDRAERAAATLTDGALVSANREYRLYRGTHERVAVSIASHGVGSAGAAICFEELIRGGARRIIRAGTCGGLQSAVQRGSVVVATAAVREDGASAQMVPLGYPAVADHALTRALEQSAAAAGVTFARGVICTHDLFYPSPVRPPDWDVWLRAGVLAVEMELATLFVLAALRGVAAAGILVADGNVGDSAGTMTGYDPHHTLVGEVKAQALGIALDAVVAAEET